MSEVLLGQSYYLRFDPKLWEAMQPYPPLGTLVSGDTVTIISASEAADGYLWYQVETATGTGWVAGTYLTI